MMSVSSVCRYRTRRSALKTARAHHNRSTHRTANTSFQPSTGSASRASRCHAFHPPRHACRSPRHASRTSRRAPRVSPPGQPSPRSSERSLESAHHFAARRFDQRFTLIARCCADHSADMPMGRPKPATSSSESPLAGPDESLQARENSSFGATDVQNIDSAALTKAAAFSSISSGDSSACAPRWFKPAFSASREPPFVAAAMFAR